MSRRDGPRVRLAQPDRWLWLEEYVLMTATYYLSCPADRIVEFGSGVFSGGRPLGTRGKFSGERRITVYGAGSVHVRAADNKGPCPVGIWQESFRLMNVYSNPSMLDAAIAAGDSDASRLRKP